MTSSLHPRSRILLPLLAVVILTVGGFVIHERSGGTSQGNVILISIDTCRPDRLSCYGHPAQTTPNIDRLAEHAVRCVNAYSPIPITLPAHASMLTGTIPPTHGIRGNLDQRLGHSSVTLAETLAENGYVTGGVVGAYVLDSSFGLDHGFEYYNDDFVEPIEAAYDSERRGEEVTHFAIEWLNEHRDDKFFLFVHYYDPHDPYHPPEPFATRLKQDLYAGEIAYTDFCIGRLIDRLKELGLYESSLIVIAGDHGEMLGEHGEDEHMYFIYESAIRVPLLFKLPGQAQGSTIDEAVGIVDVVPTVCGILGIDAPKHTQGENLTSRLNGDAATRGPRHIYTESLYATRYGANPMYGVISDSWKYIYTTRPELYDLSTDPGENTNLVEREPERAGTLRDRLTKLLDEADVIDTDDTKVALNEEATGRLRSLGYLGGSNTSHGHKLDPSLADPKDLLDLHNLTLEADELMLAERYDEAEQICEEILESHSNSYDAHHFLAKIARARGDLETTVAHLNDATRLQPNEPRLQYELANALLELGRDGEAMNHLSQVMQLRPESHEAHTSVGIVLANQGRLTEAIKHFRDAIAINPESAQAHYELGCALDRMGRIDEAIDHFSRALLIDPDHADAHNNLGVALARQGSMSDAIVHFSEALRIAPEDKGIQNNLRRAMAVRAGH